MDKGLEDLIQESRAKRGEGEEAPEEIEAVKQKPSFGQKVSAAFKVFGSKAKPESQELSAEQEKTSAKPQAERPEKFKVDLSDGTLRGKELYKTSQVRHSLSRQLRHVGGLKAGQRKEVSQMILGKRAHGLNKRELKRGLREMRKAGTISKAQERSTRRQLGM